MDNTPHTEPEPTTTPIIDTAVFISNAHVSINTITTNDNGHHETDEMLLSDVIAWMGRKLAQSQKTTTDTNDDELDALNGDEWYD